MVIIEDTSTIGEVIAINEDDITVSFNSVNLKITKDKVRKISNIEQKKINNFSQKTLYSSLDLNKKVENFKLQLDIRGMRATEALDSVEEYLDDAVMLSIHNVSILHGKGNGILRMVVREYLSKNKSVKSFHDEHIERGGHGITVVEVR